MRIPGQAFSAATATNIMLRRAASLKMVILVSSLFCIASILGESRGTSGVLVPVEAELLVQLTSHSLHTGDVVYARIAADWTGPGCALRRGATVEAKVVALTSPSKTASDSQVALSFAGAQCDGNDMKPFGLVLVAVAAPEDIDSGVVATDLPTAFGASSFSGNMRSVDQEVDPLLVNLHRFPVTANLRAGDVLGIKGVKLEIGAGPGNSSMISRNGHDVELSRYTRLLLLPSSVTNSKPLGPPLQQRTEGAKPELVARLSATPTKPPEDDLDKCAPPACSIVSQDEPSIANVGAAGSISIRSLGYTPKLQTEIASPSEDETVAYLSQNELLVAFNPHTLVPRHGDVSPGSTVRMIRAALVDTSSRTVVRTVDWRLPDDNQYLWILTGHRVLVHVGNELRVYGPGLKVEQRVELSGPLAFVRASPDGKVVAIGTIKERHSAELHDKLVKGLGHEPEEDVEIRVLNEKFEAIAATLSSTDRLPPTLLNEGQVKLLRMSGQADTPDKHYHLTLRTWDNLSRSLARFTSSCTPDVSSLAPDLIFLVTCDNTNQAREYRVMHPNGKLVLQGRSMLKKLGHAAIGDEDTKEFALKILQVNQPVLPGDFFLPSSLESADLSVYRAEDGRHLFSVRVSDPAASAIGYALAPGGMQLAVLTRDALEFYAIPPESK